MATEKTLFESQLQQRFCQTDMSIPITLQVGDLIISGSFIASDSESPDYSKIQIHNAKILTPTGRVLKFEVWECRLDAITGVAFQGAQLEEN